MSSINNVNWQPILIHAVEHIESIAKVNLVVSEVITLEINKRIKDCLSGTGLARPNVAKIAGQVAFWIRKLKPIHIAETSPNYYLLVNEHASLLVGLSICNTYKDDTSKSIDIFLPPRIFSDWILSFRYNSHSPNSSMTSFELLMCAD